jgi:hypothetical protein
MKPPSTGIGKAAEVSDLERGCTGFSTGDCKPEELAWLAEAFELVKTGGFEC